MTNTIAHSVTQPARSDIRPAETSDPTAPAHDTRWALAGLVSGIAGIGAIVASGMADAVYHPDNGGDAEKIAEALGDQVPQLLAFHVLGVISAVLMVVFAAGLYRRLRATAPADSLAPGLAALGALGTAFVLFVGTGLDTEFVFAAAGDVDVVPESLAFYNNFIGTIPWCWGLLGLSGLAVHSLSRSGAVARWLGLVGLVGGGITLLLGISPLQYMAGMTGPVGLVVISLGFLLGDKAFRKGTSGERA